METAIFWPMIAQVALTYAIYTLVSARRVGAVRSGQAKASDFRVPTVEPEPSATAARSLTNQFELPVLFYAGCLSLQMTGAVSFFALAAAWGFVIARAVHAYVHVTSNRLRYRRPLFVVGYFLNLIIWFLLAAHLLGV